MGNPLREGFLRQLPPNERMAGRSGPLRLLVVGGSLGAQALNDIVPRALALIDAARDAVINHHARIASKGSVIMPAHDNPLAH